MFTTARNVCFTKFKELDKFRNYIGNMNFKEHCIDYIVFQREKTKEGKEHEQGYIEFSKPRTRKQIQISLDDCTCHLESRKGTQEEAIQYCKKEDTRVLEPMEFGKPKKSKKKEEIKELIYPMDEFDDITWYPYQKEIIDLVETKPDKRTIYWYYETEGNVGKSTITKYLYLIKDDVIIADEGTKDNLACMIASYIQENNRFPKVFILDIPRANNLISYKALESIKNGMIFSGKYESNTCVFPHPHVIVFSNMEPDYTKFSNDRLKVKNIDLKDLVLIDDNDFNMEAV